MYAHVTSFKLRPGTAGEMQSLIEERFVPWLRSRSGFHGLHVVKASDAEMIAFGVWASKEAAEASKSEHDRRIGDMLGHLFTAPPDYREGEVLVHAPGHEPHHPHETHPGG